MWLKHTVAQAGWPAAHIHVGAELAATAHGVAPSTIFSAVAQDAATAGARMVALVLACASHIGEASVAQWAGSKLLFTSVRPQGAIPGEGASGLLLTGLQQARSIADASFAALQAMEEARGDSSADEMRRVDPKLLGELADRTLADASVAVADVGMLVADTGHRSSRTFELMGQVSARMPHLDAAEDVVRVGLACGSSGAVPFVTAIALGCHYAIERQASVLFVSNEDPYRRVVGLIRPPASPA
jgi:hypothetical protein